MMNAQGPGPAILMVTFALLIPAPGVAQVDTLKSLRTPLSPAFALMGVTPVAIERPTTPHGFSAAILSATENLSALPDSWAVEVAPYWLKARPALTYQDYYDTNLGESILRSLAFSVATARPDSAADGTDLGVGLRIRPVEGKESSVSDSIRKELAKIQEQMSRLNGQRRLALRQERLEVADSLSEEIDRHAALSRAEALELQNHQDFVGWSVDLALASVWAFPTAAFESGRNASWGAWATVGYRWPDPQLQLLLLGRFINNTRAEDQNVMDFGGRLLWDVDRLVLSVEGVRRVALDVELDEVGGNIDFTSSGRVVGSLEYALTGDAHLYASFGKDHKPAGELRHPLLATGGISFGFGGLEGLIRP